MLSTLPSICAIFADTNIPYADNKQSNDLKSVIGGGNRNTRRKSPASEESEWSCITLIEMLILTLSTTLLFHYGIVHDSVVF